MSKIILNSKKFTLNDQFKFIKFSGDKNPLHFSKEYAVKSLTGKPIVHGVNILLWSLESFEKKYPNFKKTILFEKVDFLHHININEKVTCYYNKNKNHIIVKNFNAELVKIKLAHYSYTNFFINKKKILKNSNKICKNKISDFKIGMKIDYPIYSNYKYAKELFPILSKKYGNSFVSFIANLSSLIGMYVPGKNSMLLSISFKIDNSIKKKLIKVLRVDTRFNVIDLNVLHSNCNVLIRSIFRPEATKPKSLSYVRRIIPKTNFYRQKKILIIGGSRGLGAYMVKILSLLGSNILFTYNTCVKDGYKLLKEVTEYNKKVKLIKFDVLKYDSNSILKFDPDYVFYFATPKIFIKRSNTFDEKLLKEFSSYYSKSFKNILSKFNRKNLKIIYYPSTIAIEESPDKYPEYVKSKLLGEKIAKKIAKQKKIKLIIDRLPRSSTDQTITHLKIKSQDPLELMINVIKNIYQNHIIQQ